MSYIPKDAVTQAFKSNKGVLTPNQIIELDNENKFTKYGQLELIATTVADDSSATISFTNLGDFNTHLLTCNDGSGASTTAQDCNVRVMVGGSAVSASSYHKSHLTGQADGTFGQDNAQNQTSLIWMPDFDNETNAKTNGHMFIFNAIDSNKYTNSLYHSVVFQSAVGARTRFGGGSYPVAVGCDGFQITTTTAGGNIKTGTFSLYGIKDY